jgi:tetratricopeptide (TPR) repeat protein
MQNLANGLSDLGQHEEALQLQEKTLHRKSALYGPDHPVTLASANNLGAELAKLGQHAKALAVFERTLAQMKMKHGLDHPQTLVCTGNVAAALIDLGRDDDAVPIIDDCVARAINKDVDPQLFSELLIRRVRIFQKKKDVAGCRETAERWEKLNRADAYGLFVAGRLRSVTASVALGDAKAPDAEATRRAQAEAEQAITWLRRAVAAPGFRHGEPLRNHKDFDVLRERSDFKQLLTDLERGS